MERSYPYREPSSRCPFGVLLLAQTGLLPGAAGLLRQSAGRHAGLALGLRVALGQNAGRRAGLALGLLPWVLALAGLPP